MVEIMTADERKLEIERGFFQREITLRAAYSKSLNTNKIDDVLNTVNTVFTLTGRGTITIPISIDDVGADEIDYIRIALKDKGYYTQVVYDHLSYTKPYNVNMIISVTYIDE